MQHNFKCNKIAYVLVKNISQKYKCSPSTARLLTFSLFPNFYETAAEIQDEKLAKVYC